MESADAAPVPALAAVAIAAGAVPVCGGGGGGDCDSRSTLVPGGTFALACRGGDAPFDAGSLEADMQLVAASTASSA